MSNKHNEYKYETDGAARAEYSAFAEARQEAIERTKESRQISELKNRITELEQAILSNCYDDQSTSGKRLMALVTKGGDV